MAWWRVLSRPSRPRRCLRTQAAACTWPSGVLKTQPRPRRSSTGASLMATAWRPPLCQTMSIHELLVASGWTPCPACLARPYQGPQVCLLATAHAVSEPRAQHCACTDAATLQEMTTPDPLVACGWTACLAAVCLGHLALRMAMPSSCCCQRGCGPEWSWDMSGSQLRPVVHLPGCPSDSADRIYAEARPASHALPECQKTDGLTSVKVGSDIIAGLVQDCGQIL